MWNVFFLENIHFALNLFAALVFFAITWLYFDAWLGRRTFKDGLKIAGFSLISLSFLGNAINLESSILSASLIGENLNLFLREGTKFLGYTLLILGLLTDPLQFRPNHKENPNRKEKIFALPILLPNLGFINYLAFSTPILAGGVAFLYLRRAAAGLETHLRRVSIGFYVLSFYELISFRALFQNVANVDIYNLVMPFGPIWLVEHSLLAIAIAILGQWVFSYLFKRLKTQLFMIFTSASMIIFLLTTVGFTGILLKNIQDETLKHLETNVKVLNYAIESKKAGNLSDAAVLAQTSQVIAGVTQEPKSDLGKIAESFLVSKNQNFLIVINDAGKVIARGEEPERIGESYSNDPLVKRALLGESVSGIVLKDGIIAPQISVASAVPVKEGSEIVGCVMMGNLIDNAFVDGVKAATGLEAAIYGGNTLSATTFLLADGKSRYIGIKEENNDIKSKVLDRGESYTGSIDILNTPYFASYLPLKDIDNNPVGMLFVGIPQIGILAVAAKSIEITFLITVVLLVSSIIPAYLISKYITYQIR
jgi:hypothetical protein